MTGSLADRDAAAETLLTRAVADVIVRDDLKKKLLGSKPLRVKFGVDPTRPDIHLGHYAGFRKLREFQELGHRVVVIVGDWTARIGDPSGRSAQRQMLTVEEVEHNAQTYLDQFSKVVDTERAEVVRQSAWFGKFSLTDVIQLTSKYTVARMLEREDFANRYSQGSPIAITELLYPLLQAYDSVAVHADVEVGGTDQTFNLLVGRDIQRDMDQEPQNILTWPLLTGTDGTQKMSKSLDNYIGVNEPPNAMYGKVMSIPDTAMSEYFRLLTDVPIDEVKRLLAAAERGEMNPRDIKDQLAVNIVTDLHDAQSAQEAREEFDRVFRQHEMPTELDEFTVAPETRIISVILNAGMANSGNEARRLIDGKAVRLDGERITDPNATITLTKPAVLQVGPLRWARLIPES
ncbi:MAG: tyrosine--tRNA ligase [Nitrolancea sp.]